MIEILNFSTKLSLNERKKNMVNGLEDDNGAWIDDEDKIKSMALNYFSDLFSTKPLGNFKSLLATI